MMARVIRGLVLAGMVSLVAGTGAMAAETARKPTTSGTPMNGTEIQTFAVGVPLESVGPDGSRAIITHKADGTSVYELIRGDKKTRINGIWAVRGNQFCRRFDRPKETELCLDYRRINDTTAAVYNAKKLVAQQHRLR
jgi:hypothetical protein